MSDSIIKVETGEKPGPVWKWLSLCTGGACAHCKEPLLKYRDNLVTYKGDNYHVGCLLDKLTAPVTVNIQMSDHKSAPVPDPYHGLAGYLP